MLINQNPFTTLHTVYELIDDPTEVEIINFDQLNTRVNFEKAQLTETLNIDDEDYPNHNQPFEIENLDVLLTIQEKEIFDLLLETVRVNNLCDKITVRACGGWPRDKASMLLWKPQHGMYN